MIDGTGMIFGRTKPGPSDLSETKQEENKHQDRGEVIEGSTEVALDSLAKESVIGGEKGPVSQSTSENASPDISPTTHNRESVLPSLTELMNTMGLKKLQKQLNNIKSGGDSERMVNQQQRRSLDGPGSILPLDKFQILSSNAKAGGGGGGSGSGGGIGGMEKGLSQRKSLYGLDRSLNGLDAYSVDKGHSQLTNTKSFGTSEKVTNQRRSLGGITSIVHHVQDSMKAADTTVVGPMTEKRSLMHVQPLRKSLIVLPALTPNPKNAASEKSFRSIKGSITPPIGMIHTK